MDEAIQPTAARPHRRKIVFTVLVVAALLIVALTPPLVTLNRLQRRIAVSMSESLGRPVHIDPPVTFHIFPTPGFTLHNLVVSEDPAFGNEPTIRCMNVRAQLRLASLWRHQVEFSRISFEPDENGVGASLNIVRLPDGRNNLEALLQQASRMDAAPTGQVKAGPEPRFPYIEARAARINLKLGDEKLPLSLTDAEFALWLPTAQQWSFQLKAKPARTDANVADTGVLRAEGSLERAPSLADAPILATASWHDAPLGEASLLVTGSDAGWRGTVNFDVSATGTLGATKLVSKFTLNDLRRTDFVPSHPLDVSLGCSAVGSLLAGQLQRAHCDLPVEGATPWTMDALAIDLHDFSAASVSAHVSDLPLAWVFGWFKVLSPHTPQDDDPAGRVNLDLTKTKDQPWTAAGTVRFRTDAKLDENAEGQLTLQWASTEDGPDPQRCPLALGLAPVDLPLAKDQTLSLSGSLSGCGYSYHASGTVAPAAMLALGAKLPTLVEGLGDTLPKTEAAAPVDVSCTRAWGSPQSCTAQAPAVQARKPASRHRR